MAALKEPRPDGLVSGGEGDDAADGFDAETELNMVLWSAWSANSAMGLMLSALYVAQRDVNNEYYFCNNNYGNVGLL